MPLPLALLTTCMQPFRHVRPGDEEAAPAGTLAVAELAAGVLCHHHHHGPPPLPYALRLVAADTLLAVWREPKARSRLQLGDHAVVTGAVRCWADELAACTAATAGTTADAHDPALALVLSRLLLALTSDPAAARQLFAAPSREESSSPPLPQLLECTLAYLDSSCVSLRDPLLPPLQELLWQWADGLGAVDDDDGAEAVAAATHSVAILTLLAATHARSASDRALCNDAAALLLHLIRRGGAAAVAVLAVDDGDGSGDCGGDDIGLLRELLLLAEPPSQKGSGGGVCGGAGVMRFTREDAQLVQLVWHLAAACCGSRGGGTPHACRAALEEARVVEALLGYLPQQQQQHASYAAEAGDGSGGVDSAAAGLSSQRLSATTTTARAAAATRSSLRADAWPPSLRRQLEQHALSTLAALAPVVPEHLLASGAVPALVAYAQSQLAAFTAPTDTVPSSSLSLTSTTPGGGGSQRLQPLLLSLRIVTSLAGGGGGGSSCDGSTTRPPAISACAAAARAAVRHGGDDRVAAEAAYWAACGSSSVPGDEPAETFGAAAAASDALRAATGRVVSDSGLLRDVVIDVLQRYSWSDAVSPVPDALLVACAQLLCAVFAPAVDAAEAVMALEQASPSLLPSPDDFAAAAEGMALPAGLAQTQTAVATLHRRVAAAEVDGATRHAAAAAARASFRAHGGLAAALRLLGDVCGDDSLRRGILSSSRAAVACCVLQLLYATTVGDADAEEVVVTAGGMAPLLAAAARVPPAPPASSAACLPTSNPVWEHAVGALTALLQRCTAARQVCAAWRYPTTGQPLLQALLTAWARWLPVARAHGALAGDGGVTASQAAALLKVIRKLYALITAAASGGTQHGRVAVDAAAAAPPLMAGDESNHEAVLLQLESVGRFPALLEGAAWQRAAAELERVADEAALPLTRDDAERVSAALRQAQAHLAAEADGDAQRVTAAQATHAHDLAVYTRHLAQLQAEALGGALEAAADECAGGGGGTRRAGDDRASVASRTTCASVTSGIAWRLRQGGGGQSVFTLGERKVAQQRRAEMLAASFEGYRDAKTGAVVKAAVAQPRTD